MENISLTHVGGELVLIGGIAFYFHRKTNLLQEEVASLKEENKEMSETIEELKEGMQQLAAMVMQTQPRPQPYPGPQPVPQQVPQQGPQQAPQQGPVRRRQPRQQPAPRQQPVPRQQTPPRQQPAPPREAFTKKARRGDSEDSGDDTYEDGDLDNALADEYKQLEKERDCEGGPVHVG